MTEIANIPGLGARFRCELYKGAMSPENCSHRESLALAGDERFARCLDCSQWPDVRKPVAFKPCAVDGCEHAASPILDSRLCIPHARERKAEKMTESPKPSSFAVAVRNANMAQAFVPPRVEMRCEREGCPRPRAASPSKLEGGDGLCREHRGVLARQRKAEARSSEAAKLAPISDAPTLRRDPLLASVEPISNAGDEAIPTTTTIEMPGIRVPVPRITLRSDALRVYVAAPKAEVMRARRVAAQLRAIEGVEVMSSWHDVIEEGAEDPLDHAKLKRILSENLTDLRSCDVVLALTCSDAGRGVYGEIGRALELGKLVVWSVERGGRCQDLADDRVIEAPTDAQAIQIVRTLAAWRRAA